MSKKVSIGGQAVIEGIMMKGPEKTALAVRMPDDTIDIEYIPEKHLRDKFKFFGLPFIRGIVNFIESMIVGYSVLMKSAEKSGMADLEEESKKSKKDAEKLASEQKSAMEKLIGILIVVSSVLGVALSIVLFMYLPALLFDLLNDWTAGAVSPYKAVFEGLLKMIIFFIYILLVSKMKDIRRVFEYHGAEHKTIFCYEAELPLTVENVRKQSRFHPRCGTSFMILMLTIGILLGVALTWLIPALKNPELRFLWVAIKILLLPITCGVGYELLRVCGKYDNALTRIISTPGVWMQRITTKEPDDSMIEVAIASLEAVLPETQEEKIDNDSQASPE